MTDKTKAQLKAEIKALKEQIATGPEWDDETELAWRQAVIERPQVPEPDTTKGDFRDKMISRFRDIQQAIPRKGVTEQGFIALTMQTVGGITEDTAKKYIQRMKNCGFISYKTIDLGKWKKEVVTDADGNEQVKISRDGETTVEHGETVWRTEERIFAHPRAQPSESTVSDRELKDL